MAARHVCRLCNVLSGGQFVLRGANPAQSHNALCTTCATRLRTGALQTARAVEGKCRQQETVDLCSLLSDSACSLLGAPPHPAPDFSALRVDAGVAALKILRDDPDALTAAGLTKKDVIAVLELHSQLRTGFGSWLAAYWTEHQLAEFNPSAVSSAQAIALAVVHLGDAAEEDLGFKDIESDEFTIAHLRDLASGSADFFVEGDADEAGYHDDDADAKTVAAWARALGLGHPARRALLAAIADIHAAPVIILQEPGDVLIAPPGWGHWVLTLRGQTVGDRVGAVSAVAWHTNAMSRGSALAQLISARGRELREGQMYSVTPDDIDIPDLEKRFASFNSWLGRRVAGPPATECTTPSLAAVGLHTMLGQLPDGRRSAGFRTDHRPPPVPDLIASLSDKEFYGAAGLDVRIERKDGQWVPVETDDDTTVAPANHVLQFLLGESTVAEQSRFTRCDLSSLTSVAVPSVVYDLAFHFLFHSYVINPVADAAERQMVKREAVSDYHAAVQSRPQKRRKGTAEQEKVAANEEQVKAVKAAQAECKLLNTGAAFSVMPLHNVTAKHAHHQGAINVLLSGGAKIWVLWPPGVLAPTWA